jgi:hypothetical protein
VDDAVRPLRQTGAQVEYGGPPGELARPAADDRTSELVGFAVAIVVLLVGFGSVIAAFIVSDDIVVKMPGPGLAVSVLVDATVVRLPLVPAVMTLLGRHAWWTPAWLDRIMPHIGAEGGGGPAAPAGAAGERATAGPGSEPRRRSPA